MNRKYASWTAGVLLSVVAGSTPALAQTAPPLGTAASFGVLGGSTVTNTGPTVITGDVGLSPGSSVTGFPPGSVVGAIHVANATAAQAQVDVTTAYNAAAAQPCTGNLTGQDLGGLTLTPGVYCFDSTAGLTGTLTLNAQGDPNAVFIFKVGSALTTASASNVSVINGGQACNIFWQIGSSATLGTASTMAGNILALTSITLTTGASVTGRALARNGAVTLDSNSVTAAACGAGPGPCPAITINPAGLPNATQGIAYSQTVTATGGAAPYTSTVSAGALPAGVTLNSATGLLSGTPTTPGAPAFTIRATDTAACFGERGYTLTVLAPVPTLGQWGMIGLTALLSVAGFAAIRRRQSLGA